MTLEEIFKLEEIDKQIEALKLRPTELPETSTHKAQYDPDSHDVMDTTIRLDKQVSYTYEEDGIDHTGIKIEPVNRVSLALQKVIVDRAVAFLFGNPVKLLAEAQGDQEKVLLAIKQVLNANKSQYFNRRLARSVFSMTEAAECWYAVPAKGEKLYGIDAEFKLRVALFSPDNGDQLFPLFDEYGDLIAFSREFERTEMGKTTKYFETYTGPKLYRWYQSPDTVVWTVSEGFPKINPVGKIPIIYARQERTEWEDVQSMIARLEKMISNFGDTNDYHGSPTILVKGKVQGFASKGEQGKILEMDEGADATYMSWDKAPESVKLEIDTLLRMTYALTQTPDISFESIKGLGAVSGVALKLMFIDAHLKVQNKMEVFGDYLQRRLNLLRAYIATVKPSLKNAAEELDVTPEVTPYMIDDMAGMVQMLTTATAGSPILSTRTAIELSGLVDDVDTEYKMVTEEQDKKNTFDIQEPTI
ncbi:MAG TPA: phage portal protein [Bacteroidales bacterium]|nr:phage portal protein [Bacteroidales bacterium]